MDSITKHYYHGHKPLFSLLIKTQQESTNIASQNPPNMHNSTSDFPIAIALLALMAVALLVVSYYIFVIKCCLNWHNLDPLRRFSISRRGGGTHPHHSDDSLMAFSPMVEVHRGLDEWLINNIPAFQYKGGDSNSDSCTISIAGERSFRGCAVCLNEFQEQDMLRVLPRCNHVFHLDCIDVWLLNNASCPLCRSSISGRTKYPVDHIVAPSSSPQDFSPFHGDDRDYLVIELGIGSQGDHNPERSMSRELSRFPSRVQSQRKTEQQHKVQSKKARKFQHLSIMGDECINVREKDEQFAIQQPIRRSFSMDSAVDRGLYLQVQEIIRQNRHASGTSTPRGESSGNGGRIRRPSFFSFGHGRGSSRSSSILPIENDQ